MVDFKENISFSACEISPTENCNICHYFFQLFCIKVRLATVSVTEICILPVVVINYFSSCAVVALHAFCICITI